MSIAALAKKMEKLEAQMSKLKVEINEKAKSEKKKPSKKTTGKPKSIEKCSSKSELSKFTVAELKEWVKKNKIDTKKFAEKLKADLVSLVWKNLKNQSESDSSGSESDSSSSSMSDCDSDSDSD